MDTLLSSKKTGILGIGNLLLSDEGFGIHTLHFLEAGYQFPETVLLNDAGTAGIYMAPFLEECDPILVIDVIALEAPPGSVHRFSSKEIAQGVIARKMSPHQLGLLEMLEICRLRGREPQTVEFFCVVPADLQTSMELSESVAVRVPEVAELVVEYLRKSGHDIVPRDAGLTSGASHA